MKSKRLFKLFFALLAMGLIACSSDSDENGSGSGGGNEITSISLLITNTIDCGVYVGDTIMFSVRGNNNQDITSTSTILVNGTPINGNSYTTSTTGSLLFSATYQDISTQNALYVNVAADTEKFVKHVVIEDFTGTWCGYCPRVSHAIELTKEQTDQVSVIAVHNDNEFYCNEVGQLETAFGITGYPTARIDRKTNWTFPEPNNIDQVVDLTLCDNASAGLAVTASLSGNTMTVKVDAKFSQDFIFNNTRLVLFVLEDDLFADQENYTSYYGGTSVIPNFEHDHVLRASLTNVVGDAIPNNEVTNSIYTKTFIADIPSNIVDTSKMSFVAFISNDNFSGNANIINSRVAYFGDSQTFEEN